MVKIDQINDIMKGMENDVTKVEKGGKAAAVRVRRGLMDVIKLSRSARKDVQDTVNPTVTSKDDIPF